MNLAEVWDACIRSLWGEEFVDGLESFLQSNHAKTVLDCAGGPGFPAIELKQRGWNIAYSDASDSMVSLFEKKLQQLKLNIPVYRANWLSLSQTVRERFDALLCRGNSLIYADTWENGTVSNQTPKHLLQSLREFHKMLNVGGVLYLDNTSPKEFHRSTCPPVERLGSVELNGAKVDVSFEFFHDYSTKTRTWRIIVADGIQQHVLQRQGYLLTGEELQALLNQAGFSSVKEAKVHGENRYQAFAAFK